MTVSTSSKINTMENQKALRDTLEYIFRSHGYHVYTESEFSKLDVKPDNYVIKGSRYRSIYHHYARSEFKVVNYEKDIRLRIEIKIQKSSGSVDEKFPYLYLNTIYGHEEDVLIILDGGGYKPGSKKWLEEKVESQWLNSKEKKIQILNIVDSIEYIRQIL